MASLAFYFAGVRLRDDGHYWVPTYQGKVDTDAGLTQERGTVNPDSPNWLGTIRVVTDMGKPTAISGLDEATTLDLMLAKCQRDLRSVCWGSLQPLSRCRDDDRKAAISTGSGGATGVVTLTHGAPGGSWVPAVGAYVLVREVGGPDGFVAQIQTVPSGTQVRLNCTQVVPNAGWEIIDVQVYYPSSKLVAMDPGTPPADDPATNTWRRQVTYDFVTAGEPTYASAHAPAGT